MRADRRSGAAALTRKPSLSSRLVRGLFIAVFKAQGWTIRGRPPAAKKYILVGAPHTTNWDFVMFAGATDELGISPSYLGKHSLFRWPMKRFMLDMGGIPVDRSRRSNYVDQVVAEFKRREALALVIAPEGTRHTEGYWRSGFYHIARGANVPIVPVWVSQPRRLLIVGEPIALTGDRAADMRRIAEFYRACEPENPRFQLIDADAPAPVLPRE